MEKGLSSKFSAETSSRNQNNFKEQTIGLVSASEFRDLQKQAESATTQQPETTEKDLKAQKRAEKKARKERKKAKKRLLSTLSFATDEPDDDEEEDKPKRTAKDPTMDTSFLPDSHRDAEVEAKRQRLEEEYINRQEDIKQESLEIVYSYWDGSGHRQTCKVQKGNTIGEFLEQVRQELVRGGNFPELKSVAADALLYVKEDLMLPHDLTFHDLITIKARGKSGPLFEFGVRDDVRVGPVDSRVETDVSHPGKVVERRWYERNKHIFPASRWEIFDPNKSYGRYRVGDKESRKTDKK